MPDKPDPIGGGNKDGGKAGGPGGGSGAGPEKLKLGVVFDGFFYPDGGGYGGYPTFTKISGSDAIKVDKGGNIIVPRTIAASQVEITFELTKAYTTTPEGPTVPAAWAGEIQGEFRVSGAMNFIESAKVPTDVTAHFAPGAPNTIIVKFGPSAPGKPSRRVYTYAPGFVIPSLPNGTQNYYISGAATITFLQ